MSNTSFDVQSAHRRKVPGSALLAAAIMGAGLAQMTLRLAIHHGGFWQVENWLPDLPSNSSPLPGLTLYALSAWLFIRGLIFTGHVPTQFKIADIEIMLPSNPRFGFWMTGFGLAVFTAYQASAPNANSNGKALAALWLINIALLTFSVLMEISWQPKTAVEIKFWLSSHRAELLGMILLLMAAFMVRFWNVELHPYSFINDEGEMGNNGICIIQGGCNNLFDIGWAGQPMLAFVPTGISISLLGHTATAVRLISVIIGSLSVLAAYLFAREAFGQKEAWLASLLLATLPVHVHFSRLGVDNIIDSLSTTAVLGLLFTGLKRDSKLSFLLAGILGGLCMYTYPGSRLAPMIGLGMLGYIALQKPGFLKSYFRNILIFIHAFIVTAAPITGYFLKNPNIFFARLQSEGIFQNHTFAGMVQAGANPITVLTGQFMKSLLVFFLTPAPSNFFNSPDPYLVPVAAIFFVLGFGYMIWRIREARYLVLLIWFMAEIILGSTLTGGPPTSQRMLMSLPALAVITAIGISRATESIDLKGMSARRLQTLSLLLFIIWISYQDIRFYHFEYRAGHYFEDPANEFTYETASIISPLHDSGRLYLLTDPGVPYLSFANFSYFSPDVDKAYLDDPSAESLADLPTDKDILFIATPGRFVDLQTLASLVPGGEWTEFQRRYQPGDMLYYSYKITQSDLQSLRP